MEHILQFAINIDDDRIIKNIEASAEEKIIAAITKKVEDCIYDNNMHYGRRYDREEPLKNMIKKEIERIIEENKDVVLSEASKILADKLSRTKAAKELLNGLKPESEG